MHLTKYLVKLGLLTRNIKLIQTFHQKALSSLSDFWKRPKRGTDFGSYDVVSPGFVGPARSVPEHIQRPSYHESKIPDEPPQWPEIKDADAINKMRKACQVARKILNAVGESVKIGDTTDEIDQQVHELAIAHNAYPSPLNYRGFPKSVCTSVNNVACHGIPDNRLLQDGDIVNVDITVYLDGYHGDCSMTFLIGNVDDSGKALVKATVDCLHEAINICRPGVSFCKIGSTIEEVAKKAGFAVVPAFVGHGIGSYFHGPPDIYHCYNNYPGEMQSGMTFTIEPVLSQGIEEIIILEDGWTAVMSDNGRAAQFEHTVLITDTGVEVLTEY